VRIAARHVSRTTRLAPSGRRKLREARRESGSESGLFCGGWSIMARHCSTTSAGASNSGSLESSKTQLGFRCHNRSFTTSWPARPAIHASGVEGQRRGHAAIKSAQDEIAVSWELYTCDICKKIFPAQALRLRERMVRVAKRGGGIRLAKLDPVPRVGVGRACRVSMLMGSHEARSCHFIVIFAFIAGPFDHTTVHTPVS